MIHRNPQTPRERKEARFWRIAGPVGASLFWIAFFLSLFFALSR